MQLLLTVMDEPVSMVTLPLLASSIATIITTLKEAVGYRIAGLCEVVVMEEGPGGSTSYIYRGQGVSLAIFPLFISQK